MRDVERSLGIESSDYVIAVAFASAELPPGQKYTHGLLSGVAVRRRGQPPAIHLEHAFTSRQEETTGERALHCVPIPEGFSDVATSMVLRDAMRHHLRGALSGACVVQVMVRGDARALRAEIARLSPEDQTTIDHFLSLCRPTS